MPSAREPVQTIPGKGALEVFSGDPEILSPEDLVGRWQGKVKEGTLKDWRRLGKGPEFFRLGGSRAPVMYRLESVERWERLQEQISSGAGKVEVRKD